MGIGEKQNMTAERKRVKIDDSTNVVALAEEVKSTREALILQRNDEDIALIAPITTDRIEGMSMDDSLWNIVGIDTSAGQSNIADDKYTYLSD